MFSVNYKGSITFTRLASKPEMLHYDSLGLYYFKEKHQPAHSKKIGMGGQETSNLLCSLIFFLFVVDKHSYFLQYFVHNKNKYCSFLLWKIAYDTQGISILNKT